MDKTVIIGYGSLMEEASSRETMPNLTNFRRGKLHGYRRIFSLVSVSGIRKGIAIGNELAALAVYKTGDEKDMLEVALFDIPSDELDNYKLREKRYEFHEGVTVYEECAGDDTGDDVTSLKWRAVHDHTIICVESTDEVYSRLHGREDVDDVYSGQLWGRTDIFPMPVYLCKCLLAAQRLSTSALRNFLRDTLLSDRVTSLSTYLARNPSKVSHLSFMRDEVESIVLVEPPPLLLASAFDSNSYMDSHYTPHEDIETVIFNHDIMRVISDLNALIHSDCSLTHSRTKEYVMSHLSFLLNASTYAGDIVDMRLSGIVKPLASLLNLSMREVKLGSPSEDGRLILLRVLQLITHIATDQDVAYEIGLRGIHQTLLSLLSLSIPDEVYEPLDACIYACTSKLPSGVTFPMKSLDISYLATPPTILTFTLTHQNNETGDKRSVRVRVKPIRDRMPGHFATGYKLWGGSIVLARYIFDNPSLFRSQRVIELGAGLGLPSISAYHTGCSSLTSTDYLEEVILNLNYNINMNVNVSTPVERRSRENVHVIKYDWDELEEVLEHRKYRIVKNHQSVPVVEAEQDVFDFSQRPEGVYDVVIGSDLVASVDLAWKLGKSIAFLLSRNGTAYITSADGHSRFGMSEFPDIIRAMGFHLIQEVIDPRHLVGVDDVHTFHLYKITWKQ